MKLSDLQKEAHAIAKDHGWWDTERTFGDCIALVHSELSEALEWYRKSDSVRPMREESPQYGLDDPLHGKYKPVGVPSELADVVIRVADMAEWYGWKLGGSPRFQFQRFGGLVSFGDWIATLHGVTAEAFGYSKNKDGEDGFIQGSLVELINGVERMAAHYGIDLDAVIEAKMAYNRTRSYRHGGKAL